MNILRQSLRISQDPKNAKYIITILLTFDALLSLAIIYKIPYTEIDWRAYMQQIAIYLKGEKDYAFIEGGTGPLVYPGLHVYIYRGLYKLTDGGENVLMAQVLFAGVYLLGLGVAMRCYANAKAPPYIYPLLVLSKRMHSIFMLRLFNDCFTVVFLWAAIYAYQKRRWHLGTALVSCGLGVKMNVLLVVPGLAFVLLQALGVDRCVTQGLIVSQSQGLFAYEFVRVNWRSYVGRAFQLGRQFFYKWTVNWRFVPEEMFLSSTFSNGLLAAHASLLLLFASSRWTKPARRSLPETLRLYIGSPNEDLTDLIASRVTPEFVMTTILTANSIGMLCARSLHYQFYSWTAWATPYLLWRARFHPVLIYAIWAAQEWAWNVYPSTPTSSGVVVGALAITVGGVWWGTRDFMSKDIQDGKKVA